LSSSGTGRSVPDKISLMATIPLNQIKHVLDKLYTKYNRRENIAPDPLSFVYKYSKKADIEIVGLLAAMLAYGRVVQIGKSLDKLLGIMGNSPSEFVKQFNKTKRTRLMDFKHRFNTGQDIADLMELLKWAITKYGSIEGFFVNGYNRKDKTIINALSEFCGVLLNKQAKKDGGQVRSSFKYLLSDPDRGSACKRLNLYLRWMVRNDDVDSGIWRSVDKSKLIIPMDVHMSRITGVLGFHNKKNITLKTAVEVTESFAKIEPSDPVKYDFVLCRMGMLGNGDNWKKIKGCI
jgi:uncharacterized protein (TIGR02757 family)